MNADYITVRNMKKKFDLKMQETIFNESDLVDCCNCGLFKEATKPKCNECEEKGK